MFRKHLHRVEKLRGKNLSKMLPQPLQSLRPQCHLLLVLCVKLLGMPPIIVPSFLISNLWFMKCSLSQISLKSTLTCWVHPRNFEYYTHITLVPCVIIMVKTPIISLALMNFVIALKCFGNMRPPVVEHLLLSLWILVTLVNHNRRSLPTFMILPPNAEMTNTTGHILYLSSSLSSSQEILSEVFVCSSIEPLLIES